MTIVSYSEQGNKRWHKKYDLPKLQREIYFYENTVKIKKTYLINILQKCTI